MTDRFRCSCGYQAAPDVSGADAAAICPGCGRPLLDSAITNEFRPPAGPDPFAPTQDAKLDDRPRRPKSTVAPTPPPDLPGYDILGELGRGGMGVVYKARDHALNRVVAVKMILAGAHAADAERLRFRREAEAVAALQHPGIVQIFHIGEHAGQPFLALEFVDGGNLAQRVAHGDLMPAADAAAAVEQVAHAIQYAHDQGIIHRDLKPANILISADRGVRNSESKTDPDGGSSNSGLRTPNSALFKISDFGLAKKVDETIAAGAGTKTGAVLGTPSYIAPEQATGGRTVTCTADVYSLGAILYELLTGRPPFKADTPLETVLQVLNHEPVPPARLRPKLPRDLETVCLKCLQKDPARRYQTATELADDLGRFRRGEPILARPLPAVVRGLKWVKRHPAVSAVAATAAAAVLSVVVVLAVSAKRLADANGQKEQEARTAREQKEVADKLRAEAEQATATATAANDALTAQVERNRRTLFALQLAQVAGYCERDPARAARVLDDPDQCPPDLRDFAWRYLRRLCQRDERTFLGHGRAVNALALSPDGHVAATGDDGGVVRLWSPVTRAPFAVLVGHVGPVHAAAFSPDGTTLATAGGDGTIRIWKMPPQFLELIRAASRILPSTQEEIARLLPGVGFTSTLRPAATVRGFAHAARCLTFSADGKLLAAGGSDRKISPNQWDGVAKVWTVPDLVPNDAVPGGLGGLAATYQAAAAGRLAPVRTVGGHFKPVLAVAFSPDGKTLATGGEDAGVQLVPLAGDARPEQLRQHGGPVYAVAFSPDGKTLATADNVADSPGMLLWDLTRRRPTERRKLLGHTFAVRDAAFAPDGQSIATTGSDRDATVRVWDVSSGEEKTRLFGHQGTVNRVAWLPDRRHLLTASDDRTARVWQAGVKACDSAPLDPDEPVRVLAAAVTDGGRTLLTAAADGTVRAWAIDKLFGDRPERAELPTRFGGVKPDADREWRVYGLAAAADGRRVAAATEQGVVVWDLGPADGRPRAALPRWLYHGYASAVQFAADGTVYAATDAGLRAWDAATGRETTTPLMKKHAGRLVPSRALAVSADGRVVATYTRHGTGVWLTLLTPTAAAHVLLAAADLLSAELSPDGTRLATTHRGGVRVWAVDEPDGTPALRPLTEARETALSARFGRDGRTVFAVGVNRDVLAIDPLTGQEQVTLSGHTDRIVGLGTLPKDAGLITVGRDGVVKRWRAEPLGRAEVRLWERPLIRPRPPDPPQPPKR